MKAYELSILFHPDLEMNLDPAISKVKKLIETAGGKVVKEENDGKKRLAYSINGQDYAVYYYMDLELPADAPARISSTMNIADEVLRYLLVRTDERRAKIAEEKAAKAAAEKEDKPETTEKGE